MTTLRYALIAVGLWIARLGGYAEPVCDHSPCTLFHLDREVIPLARRVVADVERQNLHSGEQKRRSALRAMLNHGVKECDAGLAIELAVQESHNHHHA